MERGYIKLYRKIDKWDWYRDANTLQLFIHLLIHANREEYSFQGIKIKRGQIVVGRKKLSEETGQTEREIRTSLSHLENTGETTSTSTNKFTIITICNYEFYQDSKNQIDQQNANNRPATDQQPTTIRELKKLKNVRNNTFVPPPFEEFKSYCKEHNHENIAQQAFNGYACNEWRDRNDKPIKSWKQKLHQVWFREDNKDKPQTSNNGIFGQLVTAEDFYETNN